MEKNQVPVAPGLFTWPASPSEKPQLIGVKCKKCGEIAFPVSTRCRNCQGTQLEEIKLDTKGKVYSFATILISPSPEFYKGPVPYSVAWVEIPGQCRVYVPLVNAPVEAFKMGMDVELVLYKVDTDEAGNDLMAYGYQPANSGKKGK